MQVGGDGVGSRTGVANMEILVEVIIHKASLPSTNTGLEDCEVRGHLEVGKEIKKYI